MMTGVPADPADHRRGEGVLEGQPHGVRPGGPVQHTSVTDRATVPAEYRQPHGGPDAGRILSPPAASSLQKGVASGPASRKPTCEGGEFVSRRVPTTSVPKGIVPRVSC